MRICLVQAFYTSLDPALQKFYYHGDSSHYIGSDHHTFEHRYIRRERAKEDIDEICKENFDVYINWMWSFPRDKVAGVEATEYLESKGVTVIGNPASSLRKNESKESFYGAANAQGLRIPVDTENKFPKIVKLADACGSRTLDYNAICNSPTEVDERVRWLREKDNEAKVIVQDFIIGAECSALVVEMGHETTALTPVEYVFPSITPDTKAFLTEHSGFTTIPQGIIYPVLIRDDPRSSQIKEAAIAAFELAGLKNGGAWARADVRVEKSTNQVYVLEVNPIPSGDTHGDDWLVENTYPGGIAALFDMLIATKQMHMDKAASIHSQVALEFDDFSPEYNDFTKETPYHDIQQGYVDTFDWNGTVLDIACGTGLFGKRLHEKGYEVEISGIDLSPGMVASKAILDHYKQPIMIGPMQKLLMGAGEYDHITCLCALYLLDNVTFTAVLSRMFMLARKSILFDVHEFSQEYLTAMSKEPKHHLKSTNHVDALKRFKIPKEWKQVLNDYRMLYYDSERKSDVFGYFVRFEKVH